MVGSQPPIVSHIFVSRCTHSAHAINCASFNFAFDRNVSRPVDGPATNDRGEIQAARQAIRDAGRAGIKILRINTDSDFLKRRDGSRMVTSKVTVKRW